MKTQDKAKENTSRRQALFKAKPLDENKLFKEVELLQTLSNSHFPVYLVYSNKYQQKMIAKVFPPRQESVDPCFERECRVSQFSHPNIIRILETYSAELSSSAEEYSKSSSILMEYAPHGNFCSLLEDELLPSNEKLVRTYFHQLIAGIECLHSHETAHMDLKLDNLLLGENYILKLTDFDSCQWQTNQPLLRRGTIDYRAPEIIKGTCKNPYAADIYSAGIILFLLKYHVFPYSEEQTGEVYNLYELLLEENEFFWEAFVKLHPTSIRISQEFKELFMLMINPYSAKRGTIPQIKRSKWYQGPTYNDEELAFIMKHLVKKPSQVNTEQKEINLDSVCNIF